MPKNKFNRGMLVTAGFYNFALLNLGSIKVPEYRLSMHNRSFPYPVMVIEELKRSLNQDTGEYDIQQVKCRWFSVKSMKFHEKWFIIEHISIINLPFIQQHRNTVENLTREFTRLAKEATKPFSIEYVPKLNDNVRLKTYLLEQFRHATPEHINHKFGYKSPVMKVLEVGTLIPDSGTGEKLGPSQKGMVRCLWYNPVEDKYDDNLWLHPSVLINYDDIK